MFKICFFVPEDQLESTKEAMFQAGAGRIGDYDHCAWQTLGVGQFRPLEGSDPFVGQQGTIERLAEYKVEMVCADERIGEVVSALKEAHPYEEPAYEVFRLEVFD